MEMNLELKDIFIKLFVDSYYAALIDGDPELIKIFCDGISETLLSSALYSVEKYINH